jgi:carboxymethylenebutenolidase
MGESDQEGGHQAGPVGVDVLKKDIKVRSSEGPQFDCYLATPEMQSAVPAVVIASAILGVNDDIRGIADDFASRGYLAAAPDLFWRTVPGPLARGDPHAAPRGEPRLEMIKSGERDLVDVLAMLRKQSAFNGRAAVMGLCYGGPYAIVGPRRLGYDAGIACHGSRMLEFMSELEGVRQPVCIFWGDQDHAAPADVLRAFGALSTCTANVEVRVFPGVRHGYMFRGNADAFDRAVYDISMQSALALLAHLRAPAVPSGT